jgi:aryl-alcohol dehydrogenase-like predicted oxidoreductase
MGVIGLLNCMKMLFFAMSQLLDYLQTKENKIDQETSLHFQMPVNLLRLGDVNLRLAAEADGAIVLGYSPMESGLLTGKFDKARVANLPSDDWRKKSPKFSQEGLAKATQIVDELTKISTRMGYSVTSLAVAWVLRQPGVTSAIVWARLPEQVADWLAALSIVLPAKDLLRTHKSNETQSDPDRRNLGSLEP